MGIGIDPAAVLDLVIGLSFLFFLSASLCSALNEAVASLFRWRAIDLEKGIVALIGSKLAESFYLDPRIKSLGHKKRRVIQRRIPPEGTTAKGLTTVSGSDPLHVLRNPSYIQSRTFAAVGLDLLIDLDADELKKAGFTERETEVIKGMRAGGRLNTESVPLNLAAALVREVRGEAREDVERIQKALENRFNETMDRVSGWYKRRAVVSVIVIGTLLTLALNIDSVHVAKTLANDPALASRVADQATADIKKVAGQVDQCKDKTGKADTECRGKATEEAKEKLMNASFPIGWGVVDASELDARAWASKLIGFLITIVAIGLGAPFWFQALSKLTPLRATGPKEGAPAETPAQNSG